MPSKHRRSRAGRDYSKGKTYRDGNKPAWLKECPTLPDWIIAHCEDRHPNHPSFKRDTTAIKKAMAKVLTELRERKHAAMVGGGAYWADDDDEAA